jgi:hypothetical protein
MRGGYFAAGVVIIAIAVMFALLPLFDGYNLIDAYNSYSSFPGEIARAVDEETRKNYSAYMAMIAIDIVLAIAGLALMIYGAAAKKD